MIGGLMKGRKIIMIVSSIVALLIVGGCTVKQKENTKAQNSKVESVQIDWDHTQWGDGGLTTPEYYMSVFERINNIEESSWGVDIPINEDNTLNLDEMYIGSDIRIGGRLFE